MAALLLHVTCREGKEIPGTPDKNKSLRKAMQLPSTNPSCWVMFFFSHTIIWTRTSQMFLWRQMPAGSASVSTCLTWSIPACIGTVHSRDPACLGFVFRHLYSTIPQSKNTSEKKSKLKGPNHLTLPACSLHAVPFNDSLDQSGDGREKEKRVCSNFSLYRHEIVVKALLSVWGGGEACGHCCF